MAEELTQPLSWPERSGVDAHARGIPWSRVVRGLFLSAAIAYTVAMAVRIYVRKYYIFLPDYVRSTLTGPPVAQGGPTHIFFVFVDHFEPDGHVERVKRWADRYVKMVSRHHDSTGRMPQHSFFFPGDQVDDAILPMLQGLVNDGFGEVELHYHHMDDTAETFRPKLERAIQIFQRYGFLKTVTGSTAFAFIHGNEGLDNADGELCGVNTELRLLHDLGCFADFTFPSLYHDAQPEAVNRIYAAEDDDRPKSYRRVLPLSSLGDGTADLMIFQGPVVLGFSPVLRRLFIDVDDGNVHAAVPVEPRRVDRWVRANIHVPQRPDWVFVKVFTHGISTLEDEDEMLGPHVDQMFTYLEHRYNDGHGFVLHYVTAREAYNLAMAAASGETGDPEAYLDAVIPPYVASAPRQPRSHSED
jgi:hypothetical protein